MTVLSGMSDMAQLTDNTGFMANFKPLSPDERAVIAKAAQMLRGSAAVPCTGCNYCTEGCPQKIDIPEIFGIYNEYSTYKNLSRAQMDYNISTKGKKAASACIGCGFCEDHCPQHIPIIKTLQKIAGVFESSH
jgi:predicted aldo/keto reductase-like oxidoreductase